MSGHSKWSTIKRQKGVKDAAKGAIFTKLGNALALAARSGTDPDTNFTLRLAIDKAKSNNMPMANIQRAIDRVSDKNEAVLTEVLYEGYGPNGVAILVSVTTDNINRTYPEVRLAFSKHGGSIADKGSVVFQFNYRGLIKVNGQIDDLLLPIIEAGAEDVLEENNELIIYTNPKALAEVRDKLREMSIEVTDAELTYLPKQTIEVNDTILAGKILRLMTALEEIDEVDNIFVNFEIADSVMETL